MNESAEIVVGDRPFTVRRTARWADCDPGGVVYAGCYTEYLLGAAMHFLRAVRGVPIEVSPEIDLPCRHMALTFHAPMVPDDVVDIQLRVAELREHTFDIVVEERLASGRLAFDGVFAPICILKGSSFEKAAIPAALRQALQRHSSESLR